MTNHSKFQDELSKILAIRKVEPEVIGELFRVFVPEIVEMALELSPKCKCCKLLLSSSESQRFELKFLDRISTPVFTGQKIKAEGCASIRVALYDCATGAVVTSGREANANIELVVLQGDSDGHGGDNLTVEEDFEKKIVKTIKGKKSLLKGNTMLKLKEGCCDIGELSFIHNSGWVKICQLSLAARVVDNFPGTTIQPAMTEGFMLKDSRTKLYLKKYPPALSDEIWRLNKIGKRGTFRERLRGENIESVGDFLKLLVMEPERLENILRAHPKTWDAITEHARTCLIDETVRYCYHPDPEHTHGVVFNVVGELKGILRESQSVPVDRLSDLEKTNARKLVMRAFQRGELTPYNDDNSFIKTSPPFSGSLGQKNPNENTDDYAQPAGTLPQANIPSISCVAESSRPDQGRIRSDGSMDFLQVLLNYPMYSPESAHHHSNDTMLPPLISNHQCQTPSMSQGDQSTPGILLLNPQAISTIDVWQRWRRVLTILNAIVTVKSIGAMGRFGAQKKRKFSSMVHK
ncbi:hypothetical protein DCAR_0729989 [Daucus carota subsp. sativus]|uniref:Uncharacterized protein n=1 Tax=Daucus carota subsp. sativus TaxID=79200 RepID=A0AAF1B8V2_DAUCS|nr:PREDICTED: calmodulin-binding protein 60 A-like [Daucus carota subsp. sativus]WOH10520.1 hypothetical protein DCAR_0729989 [Daucus carota subsp. sativus]